MFQLYLQFMYNDNTFYPYLFMKRISPSSLKDEKPINSYLQKKNYRPMVLASFLPRNYSKLTHVITGL